MSLSARPVRTAFDAVCPGMPAALEIGAAPELTRKLLEVIDSHSTLRRLWMKSARDARGFFSIDVFVRRARDSSRLVVRAKRRLRSIDPYAGGLCDPETLPALLRRQAE